MVWQPQDYKSLGYTLPTETVDSYVAAAVAAIKDITSGCPGAVRNFLCPSELLTLAGLRAFDTYYELGDLSDSHVNVLASVLDDHQVSLLIADDPVKSYSLVHREALAEIALRYKAVTWSRPPALTSLAEFYAWWDNEALTLGNDVVFGMLLGYPGEAICSLLLHPDSFDSDNDEFVSARITHSDVFDGAVPVYDYHRSLADDPSILAHEKLWSDVLAGVYERLSPT